MISSIVEKYQAVFVFAIMCVIIGVSSYRSLPRESSPEVRRPMIFVTTVYPGVSAADIESLITTEIEDELDGLQGLDKVTSTSSEGVSSITAEFTGDIDVEIALRRIRERVDVAKPYLPEDAEEPIVKELNFSDQPVFILNISNPNGLEVLESGVDALEESLKRTPGVLDVRISGKLEKEVSIEVDPSKLRHYGLSLDDVLNSVRNENTTIPGGILKNPVQQYSLAVSGEIKDPTFFGDIIIQNKEKQVKLRDLADVAFAYKDPDTINRMKGVPSISVAVTKRSGENLLSLIEAVKAQIEIDRAKFPRGTEFTASFDQSKEVKTMVADLENNIFSALILVLIVTFFFLGAINATFVSIGIPFSMLISFFALQVFGITLNMVVLFSLVLALGMLVDNGIVIVENIYRHRGLGSGAVEAAVNGTKEIAWPIASSTLTTVLAFFPIIFMPDIMGEFMSYIPKTVIIVLFSSLLVALTITPVICSRFLKIDEKKMQAMTSGTTKFKKVQAVYQRMLTYSMARPMRVLAGAFVVVVTGIILNGMFGREPIFFPKFDPQTAIVNITTPSGTPLTSTDKITQEMEDLAPSVRNSIEHLQATSGKDSSQGGGRLRSNKANLRIGFQPYLEREVSGKDYISALKAKVASYPGAEIEVEEQQGGPPSGHDISFEVQGENYAVLGELADQIITIIEPYENRLDDLNSDFEAVKPEISIEINREKAAIYGLDTRLIASSIRTAMNGSKASKFRMGKEEYDVVVRYKEAYRNEINSLRQLEIAKDGKRIPLETIASIGYRSTVETIKRRDRKRAVAVWADFKPDIEDKGKVIADVKAAVLAIQIPPGYSVGQGEGQAIRDNAQQFLVQAFIVALLLIFMVLVIQFNSVTQPFIILFAVFLSVGGVFWGLLLSRMAFNIIMSGIGIISLAGVVVNNAIVLIDFTNQLVRGGMTPANAVIEAGTTRLRPVLLTAITTVIGLLPMGLGISADFHNATIQWSSESSDWWAPMAWAIIFGLSFATVFTLIVVPVLLYIDLTKAERVVRIIDRLRGVFARKRPTSQYEPLSQTGK